MSKRNNESQKTALALAMAGGINVGEWARQNEVNKRTAYTWSQSTEVRDKIADLRRRAVDRAIGRLSRNATAASMIIIKLAKKATSEAVKLQAARAILADLMVVSNYAALEQRLAEVEEAPGQFPRPVRGPQPDQTARPA